MSNNKQRIVRFMLALALVLAMSGGVNVVSDALGFSTGTSVQAAGLGGSGSGGDCC